MRQIVKAAALIMGLCVSGVHAQTGAPDSASKTAQPQTSRARAADILGSEAAIRARKNAFTVGLASGQLEGLYPRFAAEIQKVLDDGDNLRVLPFLAYGAASNVEDLLYLHGVDVAFTQSDVLEYYRTRLKTPNLQSRISYILRLYNTELHVLAGPDIHSMEDLRGKKVSFGPAGNSAAMTGPIVFDRLNVPIEQLLLDHSTGLEKLRKGEISALVRVIGKPLDYFSKIPQGSGLHFLPIPGGKIFDDIYSLGELDSNDYPNLIAKGQTIDTISVPTVLAVFNWKKGTDRYARVNKFIEALFSKWDRFQSETFHPKWREINLAADVPGWNRSPIAQQLIESKAAKPGDESREFNAFLDQSGRSETTASADREKLFQEFTLWKARKAGLRRP